MQLEEDCESIAQEAIVMNIQSPVVKHLIDKSDFSEIEYYKEQISKLIQEKVILESELSAVRMQMQKLEIENNSLRQSLYSRRESHKKSRSDLLDSNFQYTIGEIPSKDFSDNTNFEAIFGEIRALFEALLKESYHEEIYTVLTKTKKAHYMLTKQYEAEINYLKNKTKGTTAENDFIAYMQCQASLLEELVIEF